MAPPVQQRRRPNKSDLVVRADRSEDELHSWRGVTDLLQEQELAERQQQRQDVSSTSLASLPDALQPPGHQANESQASTSVPSPVDSFFNLSFRQSPARTSHRATVPIPADRFNSVPTTPLRDAKQYFDAEPPNTARLRRPASIILSPHMTTPHRQADLEHGPSKSISSSSAVMGKRDPSSTYRLEAGPSNASLRMLSTSPASIADERSWGFRANEAAPPSEQSTQKSKEFETAESVPIEQPLLPQIEEIPASPEEPEERPPTKAEIGTETRPTSWPRKCLNFLTQPTLAQKQVLKCSIAYLLASLFTFVPFFSRLLSTRTQRDIHGRVYNRPAYSAHMVATIVCYFHPARSVGGMLLASKYCIILASLAAVTCLFCILTQFLFDKYTPSNGAWVIELGDIVALCTWVCFATGGLAWLKQWVSNPSFNTGCSMAAVTLFTVVVKEGGLNKLAEVLLIVVIGATISNIVCYTLWPTSATSRLQGSITTTIDSFGTLLNLLSATFLLDAPPGGTSMESLSKAVKSHNDSFTKLKADLAEAQNERLIDSRMSLSQRYRYAAVVDSLQKLAQHLTGMRTGTELQMELLQASQDGLITLGDTSANDDSSIKTFKTNMDKKPVARLRFNAVDAEDRPLTEAGNLFLQYRESVAERMRELVTLSTRGLGLVKLAMTDFESPSKHLDDLTGTRNALESKLKAFRALSLDSAKKLFAGAPEKRYEELFTEFSPLNLNGEEVNDKSGPIDAIYSIDFFVFTLEEFVRELSNLIEAMVELLDGKALNKYPPIVAWLSPSYWQSDPHPPPYKRQTLQNRVAKLIPIDPSDLQPTRVFPDKRRNTVPAPERESLSTMAKFKQSLWRFQARVREPDIKYAIKVGLGTVILALPAFIESWRDVFLEFRGEWALIAFWATMNPSIGGTNKLSMYRIGGTLCGAIVAVTAYEIFPEDPVALPIFGFFFSMPCFWIITQRPAFQQVGRFILLTYNLTCLYAYNQRRRDLTALEIGWRRSTSVLVGVIWATIVSNHWWPFAARRELRLGLSDFSLDLAYLYSQLVQQYSGKPVALPEHPAITPEMAAQAAPDERSRLLDHTDQVQAFNNTLANGESVTRHFMRMELHLQIELINLRSLLGQTKNEPRLKGPFPRTMYAGILNSCQNLLDKLHSMRCVITRREWDSSVYKDILVPINEQRREMVGDVILYFYLISAAFQMRQPMPPILPQPEMSRRRVMDVVKNLDIVKRQDEKADIRKLLMFAYALAMQGIIKELDYLGGTLQDAFGVISQTSREEFEALFV